MIKKYDLIFFDMDGVIADIDSSWWHLHKKFSADNSNNLIDYLKGRIDYSEFMSRDISMWGRKHINDIKSAFSDVRKIEGTDILLETLKTKDYYLVLLSAGVSILADLMNKNEIFDEVYSNELCTDEYGYLTGKGIPIVELNKKHIVLKNIAQNKDVSLDRCVYVGDSKYDIDTLKIVGLSIAFNTNDPSVKKAANLTINKNNVMDILEYL